MKQQQTKHYRKSSHEDSVQRLQNEFETRQLLLSLFTKIEEMQQKLAEAKQVAKSNEIIEQVANKGMMDKIVEDSGQLATSFSPLMIDKIMEDSVQLSKTRSHTLPLISYTNLFQKPTKKESDEESEEEPEDKPEDKPTENEEIRKNSGIVYEIDEWLIPLLDEGRTWAFPLTGLLGLHHFQYTQDLSLAVMYCIAPGLMWFGWVLDFFTLWVDKRSKSWGYIRWLYCVIFHAEAWVFFKRTSNILILPNSVCFFFIVMFLTNTLGASTCLFFSFVLSIAPDEWVNKVPAIIFFLMLYYSEKKLYPRQRFNDWFNKTQQKRIYTTCVFVSVVFYTALFYYPNELESVLKELIYK